MPLMLSGETAGCEELELEDAVDSADLDLEWREPEGAEPWAESI